ncbi:SDR family NAD(P)-dependent oxidoreductase [Spongiactinospora sp. TRM90649]|uniref:SDR family NAD(P)-dependent oxidoreductase n=1 Tax=Spongiactinospora sp. TRM90649 TaxID=3031114 RepID=UPI0023F7546F|nr:SDR family NAD(P)-dependent oxidoreductase [Spongiactinospora sp. TRM90649]MDF5756246.1 SDR family NAD(P)-dependent oxidoreductase [Spongiactinospora sp. TRM90649]
MRDLAGRRILLTGATSGLGRAAASEFAARGATLTIVGRDETRTRSTADELRRATGNPAVDHLIGDLSVISDMHRVAADFRARSDRLDVLVNNAGAIFDRRATTPDGLETTFALNHLAYFVITTGLLGLLRETPGARVVSTASVSHRLGRLDLDRVATPGLRSGFRAYCDSKLANVLFTRELARRLAPAGVTANCMHPGFVRSRFFARDSRFWTAVAGSPLAAALARAPERAADTLVWLAADPGAAAHTGEYFVDRAVTPVSRMARDAALASDLWALSERLAS